MSSEEKKKNFKADQLVKRENFPKINEMSMKLA